MRTGTPPLVLLARLEYELESAMIFAQGGDLDALNECVARCKVLGEQIREAL